MRRRLLRSALLAAGLCLSGSVEGLVPSEDDLTGIAGALARDDQCAAGDSACALSALQLRGQKVVSAAPATVVNDAFNCASSLKLGSVVAAGKKGMCLDDSTFESCAGEIPRAWPHTGERITSMRLFKPWGISPPTVFRTNRTAAWASLKAFAEDNQVQFLLGVSVSCNEADDDKEWELAKAFMQDLGPSHFMGLAIGNELELLWKKGGQYQNPACLNRLWGQHGYYKKFVDRVAELDSMPGFSSLPVTAVFGLYATAGNPWAQNGQAGINDFLTSVWKKFGARFVFSFNLYPYFDSSNRCNSASIASATSFAHGGQVPRRVENIRSRMAAMGAGSARLWVGETGWSTPQSSSVAASVAGCQDFSSHATFKAFYQNFLSWDVSGADHVFYFTIHDSKNFDSVEHFGLIDKCGSTSCKLQ